MSTFFSRAQSFITRAARGQDVVLVPQTVERWDRQYAKGGWDFLLSEKPNTVRIAMYLRKVAERRGSRLRVLDVGCGNGALAQHISKDVEYCGLDVSAVAIEQAQKVSPTATFYVCDAAAPPADLGTFDAIVFNEILYYVDPRIILPLYARYATKDTVLCISVLKFARSFFVWARIRRFVRFLKKERISNRAHQGSWEVAFGVFKDFQTGSSDRGS